MIDCEFDTLILSLVLIWIFYVFNFNLQLSNTIDLLIKKINFFLLKDGIRSFNASRLLAILQNKYKPLYNVLLDDNDSYYDIFESFKVGISRLRKPIVVIWDDVDRINQVDHLKKLFFISEKLSNSNTVSYTHLDVYKRQL